MSEYYVHIEISRVGPGHAKIGKTVVRQHSEHDAPDTALTAYDVEEALDARGFTDPHRTQPDTSLEGVS